MFSASTVLRSARRRAGLSQRELGRRAGTSGAAVAAYETGTKEPRLSTLQRLVTAAGQTLRVGLDPDAVQQLPLSRADRISLALHRRILAKLLVDEATVRAAGRRNIERMRVQGGGSADAYLGAWSELLRGSVEELVAALTALDQCARDLRQVTPFAGVLAPQERWDVVRADRRRRAA